MWYPSTCAAIGFAHVRAGTQMIAARRYMNTYAMNKYGDYNFKSNYATGVSKPKPGAVI